MSQIMTPNNQFGNLYRGKWRAWLFEDNKYIEEEEEWTHLDERVSLVVQRLLYTPKRERYSEI